MPEEFMKWIPVCDALVLQAYYRVLSFVSIHAPIDEVYQAIKHLAETKRGGDVYWAHPLLEGRVARWDGLEVYPDIKMSLWVFGSKLRRKNTVYARVGWWNFYLISTFGRTLKERALV